ncbi:MAG: hypothetical protein A2406_04175 [Candidatus Komeilibacteria bacterium RIFOXYC1_FULL_37_11]|uniref:Phospholipid/glycerol acyltransferase domain-containing protein n=1 Tax=Candidatus Komeilibacteria bacterium RIFOXYC1_FULL_37_11 TaxID=1798555 RepID=A0A1G2BX20_9BACT|nr:MAG: hypothetical protein A2406_04175 [Candidatus Komeilibacteria bacterium RIFOXYC1_FULL_37_11]OGY95822.1 MAG: hypothetical protein A2611_03545 [Candidatus Komeilibacteria bacterium RIFOXYD1_FULL_37_29]OGY96465.1 MAG: hypothetical protein A2543_00805 [Candidatus Komeilibacteria bacterium RIFOXYD2_FULL_37_8]
MFYKLLQFFLSPLIRFFWVGNVNDIKNIPFNGSAIVAANHNSYLDFFILSSILKRRIYFLAGEVFFKSKLWKPLMLLTGQIKVDRYGGDKKLVYAQVEKVLINNSLLGIFPEGTRSRNGKLQKGYNGAVKFAYQYKVPIIPVGIIGTFDAWPPNRKFPKLIKSKVNIGCPFRINSNDFDSETSKLMDKIALLSDKVYEE